MFASGIDPYLPINVLVNNDECVSIIMNTKCNSHISNDIDFNTALHFIVLCRYFVFNFILLLNCVFIHKKRWQQFDVSAAFN